ncbi:hypothetical protein FEM08_13050 [Flavobacterium gilvum]|nr:hypothetical protein FEM08_13050 [Flavobacterium gilvum]
MEQNDLAFSVSICPAIRCNLFIFKEKIKRIFTSIGAKKSDLAFLTSSQKALNLFVIQT